MTTILDQIVASTRIELERRKPSTPVELLATVPAPRAGLRDALARPGLSLIAEFKRRSPSAGAISADAQVADVARAYERGGATAMSVLTDEPYFGGSLEDLRAAATACSLPLLRKDFIIDSYQLHEARAAGASGVLLIVAALPQLALASLHGAARELGLDVLVEVHDRDELARAAAIGAELIGVNNRDLRDFSVDPDRTFALLEEMPAGALVVAESGISSSAQLARLAAAGVAGALVGERLMRAADPALALRELLAVA
ncbi:MAG: indole-3-glycerol phosphate synthase TrpC [Solirubrobacteraceae bacterium]|jgi:indole-3-glycerol phosphate synthase